MKKRPSPFGPPPSAGFEHFTLEADGVDTAHNSWCKLPPYLLGDRFCLPRQLTSIRDVWPNYDKKPQPRWPAASSKPHPDNLSGELDNPELTNIALTYVPANFHTRVGLEAVSPWMPIIMGNHPSWFGLKVVDTVPTMYPSMWQNYPLVIEAARLGFGQNDTYFAHPASAAKEMLRKRAKGFGNREVNFVVSSGKHGEITAKSEGELFAETEIRNARQLSELLALLYKKK